MDRIVVGSRKPTLGVEACLLDGDASRRTRCLPGGGGRDNAVHDFPDVHSQNSGDLKQTSTKKSSK